MITKTKTIVQEVEVIPENLTPDSELPEEVGVMIVEVILGR